MKRDKGVPGTAIANVASVGLLSDVPPGQEPVTIVEQQVLWHWTSISTLWHSNIAADRMSAVRDVGIILAGFFKVSAFGFPPGRSVAFVAFASTFVADSHCKFSREPVLG